MTAKNSQFPHLLPQTNYPNPSSPPTPTMTDSSNPDRLNQLPLDIISIISSSFLTTKSAIKITPFISKHWRFAWTNSPNLILNFHESRSPSKFIEFVENLLSLRANSDVNKFDLVWIDNPDMECITKWLLYAINHNVQEISLTLGLKEFKFPSELFSCAMLKSFHLSGLYNEGAFILYVPCVLELPTSSFSMGTIKSLELLHVEASGVLLGNLIANCPELESLVIDYKAGGGEFAMSVDALKLKYLMMKTVLDAAEIMVVVKLLQKCPCLEKFVLQNRMIVGDDVKEVDSSEDSSEGDGMPWILGGVCRLSSLKYVDFYGFIVGRDVCQLVKFLLEEASSLEKMKIRCSRDHFNSNKCVLDFEITEESVEIPWASSNGKLHHCQHLQKSLVRSLLPEAI